MHDCPTCKVPLHGYEEECPSCGTKQYVKPEYRQGNMRSHVPKAPGVNPVPIIVAVVIIGIAGIFAMQSSWIGQLMTKGPTQEDPMDKVTWLQARDTIENGIKQGFTSAGAKVAVKYTSAGAPVTKVTQGPVEMVVDLENLADPNSRKGIIDPIKDYMDKAQIATITVNDAKTHATWTYACALTTPKADDGDPLAPLKKPEQPAQDAAATQEAGAQ